MAGPRSSLTVVVLAAGLGKRMVSKRIKLLHEVAGQPMVAHVLQAARAVRPSRIITVVGHQADRVREAVGALSDDFVVQARQLGTGHAVLRAAARLRASSSGTVLILNGDLPTLRPATLRELLARHRRSGAALTVVTCEAPDPTGYGRIVRDGGGRLQRIVEHRDASPAQRRIREINCGIYCARSSKLLAILRALRPDNVQAEYYLPDAVHELLKRGERVEAFLHRDAEEVLGVNTRDELARAARTLHARKARALQQGGVTLLDPEGARVDPRARVGRDSILHPGVTIEGRTVIGEDCVIRPGARLVECTLGRGVEILDHSVLTGSRVGDGARVGPFAHLRPGAILGAHVKVGNFVEIKQSRLARGVKASHLSYLGDSVIGEESNIGAGTITCNYDGERKNRTRLGRRVFVGSDTQLVAPVTVGEGAYVGAGTTVTKDVPAGALAIGRAQQRNIEGWVARRKAKKRKGKAPRPA